MDHSVKLKGNLPETTVPEVFSAVIKSDINDCNLTFLNRSSLKTVFVKDNHINFIYSDDAGSTLYEYLKINSKIKEADLDKAKSVSEGNGLRLGKSLVELNLIDYKDLWNYITSHQHQLLDTICNSDSGEYGISEYREDMHENITLDIPLSEMILNLIRNHDYSGLIRKKFEMVEKVFLKNRNPELPKNIFPYEKHILKLCKRYRDLDLIIEKSELTEADTLRYIYYFILVDVISTEKTSIKKRLPEHEYSSVNISFSSYEEALKHYNLKFEMIFKLLSKEIGPVAMSILTNSIDDIRDNLPVFLKDADIDKNGKLIEKKILKKVWYHDYENHSAEFVRGLEELLYAQIFAVKKNLGIEYENQILKWLKGIGS